MIQAVRSQEVQLVCSHSQCLLSVGCTGIRLFYSRACGGEALHRREDVDGTC
jgi:hypothetical protein